MSIYIFIFIFFGLLNYFFLKKYIHLSHRLNIISKPKIKDSHKTDKPKGGGIIFFVMILLFLIFCFLYNNFKDYYLIYLLALPVISIFSFLDDIYDYKWFYKLIIDALTIFIIFIFFLYNEEDFIKIDKYYLFYPLIILSAIWFINLINFTDGSDGYLTVFTIYCFTLNLFYGYINYDNLEITKLFFIMIFLIFLYYNKEPAKLFLGDVGSRLIAVLFLINILYDYIQYHGEALKLWLIILLPVLLDTGFTLAQRVIKKKLLSRHRDHAYQILANNFNHNKSIFWMTINYLIFILPSIILISFNLINFYFIIIFLIIILSLQIFYIKIKYYA